MTTRKRLRVGILMDTMVEAAWAAAMVRDLLNEPCVEVALIVMHREPPAYEKSPARRKDVLGKLVRLFTGQLSLNRVLFQLYARWDARRVKLAADPFEPVDLSADLKDVPRLDVIPLTDRYYHRFEDADLEKIRAADLDVIVRLGFNILKGPILTAARYGIWSYHHGDNTKYRGAPPYFWELYNDEIVCGVILQILSERLDAGRVLYRSYSGSMSGVSIQENRILSYWKSSSFIVRRLRQLHQHGWEWMQRELPTMSEDPKAQGKVYRVPTNGPMLYFLARSLYRKVHSKFIRHGMMEHWLVLFRRSGTSEWRQLQWEKNRFYADPFLVHRDGRDYIFFEDYFYKKTRGLISYVEVKPDLTTTPAKIVLDLPYHLSYPFIFEENGELLMIPETGANRTVELYRAAQFPDKWELVKVLKKGIAAFDVTLLVRDGTYWFFCCSLERGIASSDELFLFHSDSLMGEWTPHPKNPIVSDVRSARPAGHFFERGGKLIRPSQDGSKSYGSAIQLNEVVVLTKDDYRETPIDRIAPDWCPTLVGTHTTNCNGRIEVRDARAVLPLAQILDSADN